MIICVSPQIRSMVVAFKEILMPLSGAISAYVIAILSSICLVVWLVNQLAQNCELPIRIDLMSSMTHSEDL